MGLIMLKKTLLPLALLAVSLAASASASAGDATIVMKNFDFAPMALTVKPGTTVTWKNLDEEPHTVVSTDGLFRSRALDENDVFSFKFDKPGVYRFVCSIHPKMMGTITIK